MATVGVTRAGLHTTVQDLGRWGFQSFGVPVAGAMDQQSHRMANALVGNAPGAATLEVTIGGPELEFELAEARLVAVSGALFDLMIDGHAVPTNTPFEARDGSKLRFGLRRSGARAYIAVAGGIACPAVFGSRATHVGSRMGGVDGRALVPGDRVPLGEVHQIVRLKPDTTQISVRASISSVRLQPAPGQPAPGQPDVVAPSLSNARVRVLPGPQDDVFADDALEILQSRPYTLLGESNRMGFRLQGPILRHRQRADIISDATPLGALQVPASGQPMLLMADRQTTGGYPKIATVIAADIALAAQLAPGDTISFEVCTLREAMAALVAGERALMALEGRA